MLSEWEVRNAYDYRFGAITLRVSHKGETSPIYQIPMKNLLQAMPYHDLMAYLKLESPANSNGDIEEYRRNLIKETDMAGKTVLDVGGYDGVMAKLALDCGAKEVICLDNYQYKHYGWADKKHKGVKYVQGDLYHWDEPADIVIAYNILYHTHHPWGMLTQLRRLTRQEMLLCTLFRYHDGAWLYLYEPRECNNLDETVYFGPSLEALERLLKLTGWTAEQYALALDRVLYRCTPNPTFVDKHPEPGD